MATYGTPITHFQTRHETWSRMCICIRKGIQLRPDRPCRFWSSPRHFDSILANKEHLSDWTRWVQVQHQAQAAGLNPLVAALEAGALSIDAEPAFVAA